MAATKTKKKTTTEKNKANGLHLPSFTIKKFRGFEELHLPELGRVTLLIGENSVGKSTVLEAAQLYASAGDPSVITHILDSRENVLIGRDENGEHVNVPDHGRLFFGYNEPEIGDAIEIGFTKPRSLLSIKLSFFEDEDMKGMLFPLRPTLIEEPQKCLVISFGTDGEIMSKVPFFHSKRKKAAGHVLPMGRRAWRRSWRQYIENIETQQIPYETLGPELPSNARIASLYETVELTSEEEPILDVLRFIEPNVERLAPQGGRQYDKPRMMVKLKNVNFPVPLRSMGEGIVHLLGLAVTLISAKNGLLLIDEIENGIHHSLFPKLWKFIMYTAEKNNVQVIAATHSWDCFKGFARIARETKNIEGRAIRIERGEEKTRAIAYSEKQAFIAARSGIEVR